MRVVKKNNLQKVAGSRNMRIPTSTAPTAPIPVHTGYAVPKGMVCVQGLPSCMVIFCLFNVVLICVGKVTKNIQIMAHFRQKKTDSTC